MRERHAREEAERIAFDTLERMAIQAKRIRDHTTQVEAALEASRDAQALRKGLVNSAAHVLRTPMTSLLIRLHTIMLKAEGETKERLEDALRVAKELNEVLNDLVRVGQLDAGAVEVDMELIELANWVVVRPDLDVAGADGADTRVVTDPVIISDIVSIIFRLEGNPESMPVHIRRRGNQVSLRFTPSENGVDAEEIESLGLGSYLARGLATAIGGNLEHGEDALGRRFWELSFPAAS